MPVAVSSTLPLILFLNFTLEVASAFWFWKFWSFCFQEMSGTSQFSIKLNLLLVFTIVDTSVCGTCNVCCASITLTAFLWLATCGKTTTKRHTWGLGLPLKYREEVSTHTAVWFRPGKKAVKHLNSVLKQFCIWRTVWCLQQKKKKIMYLGEFQWRGKRSV